LQLKKALYILAKEYQKNPIFFNSNKSSIMKRRVRKIANFFAFNLLFFALYLNFIHKDKSGVPAATQTASQQNTAAFSGTVLVDNPEKLSEKGNAAVSNAVSTQKNETANTEALKLSIN
jgi:hypothetical protein